MSLFWITVFIAVWFAKHMGCAALNPSVDPNLMSVSTKEKPVYDCI